MTEVGGDRSFLNEVLQDLLSEAQTSEDEIENGIAEKNFKQIKEAAHRMKGSAAYLKCFALQRVSNQLQDAGMEGMKAVERSSSGDKIMGEIEELFEEFKRCLRDLRDEIRQHK